MGKIVLIGVFVLMLASSVLGYFSNQREQDLQVLRNAQQSQLLVKLESVNLPVASQLVEDWQHHYPNPSDKQIAELRIILQRVQSDPAEAEKYTVEYKQKSFNESALAGATTAVSLFGLDSTPKFKPGL
ncbi:hypothetical protein [Marinobacterium sp. BA1]|uniref:hypothetical protein n=1 Tax=Marinobacterium sp. BA1 TaxID=3138931 RepID=UPI0032E654EF